MKSTIIFVTCFFTQALLAHALVINEIMSNPLGDDSGREWVELYNDTDANIDLSTLTVSIKGGAFASVVPVSGGTSISSHGYAIVGSTVSGATKFLTDYPSYTGPLFRSSISLVNSGVTSIDIKVQGVAVDSLPSYTAAKEGSTYSLIGGSFMAVLPTPGAENLAIVSEDTTATSTGTTGAQVTLSQTAPPTSDIVFYLPKEKTVVAGAPSTFSVYALTSSGRPVDNVLYSWSFGDGGERSGSSTLYTYFYPGRYVAEVEATNGIVAGVARTNVRALAPDISISPIGYGKYGPYIDITNPNSYELNIATWILSIDGAGFPFPKNTILQPGVTRFSGVAMHFASTTVSTSTVIKILFPTMEEIVRVYQGGETKDLLKNAFTSLPVVLPQQKKILSTVSGSSHSISQTVTLTKNTVASLSKGTTTKAVATKVVDSPLVKDTRIANFFKSFFGK